MNNLASLPNIGDTLAQKLEQSGISSFEELKKKGAEKAFVMVRLHFSDACLNTLFALDGAIQDIRWHNLPEKRKESLRNFFNAL